MEGQSVAPEAAGLVEVKVRLLRETRDSLLSLGAERGWDEEEALRIALSRGLAELSAEAGRREVGPAPDPERETDSLRRRLAECEGRYSAMKYRAFALGQDNRALEFQVSGLRGSDEMWKAWAADARARMAGLEEENRRLRRELGLQERDTVEPAPVAREQVDQRDPLEAFKRFWRARDRGG
jgi:hypothetical protein